MPKTYDAQAKNYRQNQRAKTKSPHEIEVWFNLDDNLSLFDSRSSQALTLLCPIVSFDHYRCALQNLIQTSPILVHVYWLLCKDTNTMRSAVVYPAIVSLQCCFL